MKLILPIILTVSLTSCGILSGDFRNETNQLRPGMTRQQITSSFGQPYRTSYNDRKEQETLTYRKGGNVMNIMIKDDKVISWR